MRSFLPPQALRVDKTPGAGEDSDPIRLVLPGERAVALGVFDGLGGSGARIVQDEDGRSQSSAALASALAARISTQVLESGGFESSPGEAGVQAAAEATAWQGAEWLGRELQQRLRAGFKKEGDLLEGDGPSPIRGTMSKRLPTTACLLIVEEENEGRSALCSAIWAGDSRAYVWTAGVGLQQLTQDHTRKPLDALEAILDDPPMSNLVSPDIDGYLELHAISVRSPCLFACGSDGSFNYFPSPMDFEAAILGAIREAKRWEDVAGILQRTIVQVAQDDISFAFSAHGYSWPALQDHAKHRLADLERKLRPLWRRRLSLQGIIRELAEITKLKDEDSQAVAKLVNKIWADYRVLYEAHQPPGNRTQFGPGDE